MNKLKKFFKEHKEETLVVVTIVNVVGMVYLIHNLTEAKDGFKPVSGKPLFDEDGVLEAFAVRLKNGKEGIFTPPKKDEE